MNDVLIYIGLMLGLFVLSVLWLKYKNAVINWLKGLFPNTDINNEMDELLNIVNFVAMNFKFKYSVELGTIIKHCKVAKVYINDVSVTDDLEDVIQLSKDKAYQICQDNGILLSVELVTLVDMIVEFLFKKRT